MGKVMDPFYGPFCHLNLLIIPFLYQLAKVAGLFHKALYGAPDHSLVLVRVSGDFSSHSCIHNGRVAGVWTRRKFGRHGRGVCGALH